MPPHKSIDAASDEIRTELAALIQRASQGDESALPRLRELLDQYPVWQDYGDLACHAEQSWIALAAGTNLYLQESLTRKASAMAVELLGPTPTPIERLLARRVVACWLRLHYYDTMDAQKTTTDVGPQILKYRLKRQEIAQRSYLSALAALTTAQRLLPARLDDSASLAPSSLDRQIPARVSPPKRRRKRAVSASLNQRFGVKLRTAAPIGC